MRADKKIIFSLLIALIFYSGYSQDWRPVGDKIKTEWASEIDSSNPLPEYPRPLMEREAWINLNGLWDYAVTNRGFDKPSAFEGQILVPYPIESSLSGVQKRVGVDKELWYERRFTVPDEWKGKDIVLHFGAVDWEADVWINDIKIGSHRGGYTPFSFDITPFLNTGEPQKLTVKVWDPSDKGDQPRGKQVEDPRGIWYTPVTGIWQTVWLEPVNAIHITGIKAVPNIDSETITVSVEIAGGSYGDIIEIAALEGSRMVGSGKGTIGQEIRVSVPNTKLWSPESPFLYDMQVSVYRDGDRQDEVKSYFGMRKISTSRDANGIVRMQLNNKDYFHFGPLDQGWWPDGLYTAPTDEALYYDIKKTKDFGFNMIRKHVKVEPARWYYHCDKEGILVWQYMPSGDAHPEWQRRNYFNGKELERSVTSENNFRREWKEVMDLVYSNPSVVVWVPFNERWGQFKTKEIAEWTKDYDPSRLVNSASGGNHYPVDDILDMHHYPEPIMGLYDSERVNVLGEYGGIGLVLHDHLWEEDRNWGYVRYNSSKEATDVYVEYGEKLKALIPFGYSGAVYTQTTDVEIEVNGIMTYDRKVVKLDEGRIKKINKEICESLN